MKRHALRTILVAASLLWLAGPSAARAGVVVEGNCTSTAPEKVTLGFRLVLTRTGARIAPSRGEVLVVSYAKGTVLVLDGASRSYVVLPIELAEPLLAESLGYQLGAFGAAVSGKSRKLLGQECGEVVVSGGSPKVTLRSWRIRDPVWSREYALLERALGLPWTAADPPAVITGIPLSLAVEVGGQRPANARCEATKLTRDDAAGEDYSVPVGWRMDYERLLTLQLKNR